MYCCLSWINDVRDYVQIGFLVIPSCVVGDRHEMNPLFTNFYPPYLFLFTNSFMEYTDPVGTIVFTTVGRPNYGFDIFSLPLPSASSFTHADERRLTDGISVNFNGQFVGEDGSLVYISERTGSAQIFLNDRQLSSPSQTLFHDRPVISNHRLYFTSAHHDPHHPFKSWSALYSTHLHHNSALLRLTPNSFADYSPAISQSGTLIAVASYGSQLWPGEFHDLQTHIVAFQASDPAKRVLVSHHGGWPSWSGDSTIYFHRQADDGWWSIFRADLPNDFMSSGASLAPIRVTPPGLHCFTPAAMHSSNRIAVATRRKGKAHRHIEIFDVESRKFQPVTELLNPNVHHYNPFVSPESTYLGYHRFRGVGEATIPHLDPVASPIQGLSLFRLNGSFPAFSPSGDLIALNLDFESTSASAGLKIVKSDGSKRWTLLENCTAFYNSWSPTDKNVIFTSIGPIFESERTSVEIARVTFDPVHMAEDGDKIPANIKILTKQGTGNNAFPSCSPDGKLVVFRSGRSGHKNLYIVDAVRGEVEGDGIFQLTEGPWIDTMPSWSPDGKLIAFSSNRHNPERSDGFGIYLVRPDGSGVRRVKVGGVEEGRERLNHVCFMSGEWLLFTANLGGVSAEPVSIPNQFQPYGELYMVRLDGSGLKRLTWNGYEDGTPAWHPKALALALNQTGTMSKGEGKLDGQFDEPLWIKTDF